MKIKQAAAGNDSIRVSEQPSFPSPGLGTHLQLATWEAGLPMQSRYEAGAS